jgi:hypothetical protein
MAREGILGGTLNLFAWTVGIVLAVSLTSPVFKALEGAIISWRHSGKSGGA